MVFLEPIWRFFPWEHWLLLLFPALPGPNCPVTTGRAVPRSPFVRDHLNLKTLFLKQQETEVKFEAINVSDRSSVVTSWEFGGCLSVLLPRRPGEAGRIHSPMCSKSLFQDPHLNFPSLAQRKGTFWVWGGWLYFQQSPLQTLATWSQTSSWYQQQGSHSVKRLTWAFAWWIAHSLALTAGSGSKS